MMFLDCPAYLDESQVGSQHAPTSDAARPHQAPRL